MCKILFVFKRFRVESFVCIRRLEIFILNFSRYRVLPKSKDIKRVHSVKNAVFRTSHGFAKLTSFTRHQKQIKYSKKNLICCVFSQNYRENAVRNAKSGIFKEKTLSSFISGQNFSTITVSDLFYSHKKYG